MSARSSRIWVLDLVRGVFMVTMIVSHSIFFFHANTNSFLQIVAGFGDIVSFTGLLVISGATAYASYIHFEHSYSSVIVRLLKRLPIYLVGYYLLALWASGVWQHWDAGEVVNILTFQRLVPFTEFIVPFIFLGLLKIPLRPLFQLLSKSLNGTIIVSTLLYFLSTFLAYQDTAFWGKMLLVGISGVYSFPLLGYLPLYLVGLYLGRRFYVHSAQKELKKFMSIASVLLACGVILVVASPLILHVSPTDVFNRFPPSPAFLLAGLAFSFFAMACVLEFEELKNFPLSRTILLLLGQNTFSILITYTALLYAYHWSDLPKVHSPILTILLGFFSTLLAIYFAKVLPLNYSFSLTFVDWCECNWRHCKHAKEHSLVKLLKRWLITIVDLPHLFSVTWEGHRIQLVKKWNIVFAGAALLLAVTPLGIAENNSYFQNIIGNTTGSVNKTWVLTTNPSEVLYTLSGLHRILDGQPDVKVTYQLNNETPQIMESNGLDFIAKLPRKNLTPGIYTLTGIITVNYSLYKTQPTTLYVSAPLLVTWTIDWEGYDSPDSYLSAMDTIANEFQIPITQMYNPHNFSTSYITPERAEFLTNWVRHRRDTQGDEIGLHIHMYPDFVKLTGVTPITDQTWGGGWTPGYDILTSAYSYDDMVRILSYAKEVFKEHDLGQPSSYRAGAWFANLETLAALSDTGFLVDSSGRTPYTFGTNQIPGFWDLTATTQPYFPSTQNQNSPNPPPRLSILEVPDNGADDYAFSASEMIDRFKENYIGGILTEPKQVTYLTHPNWFDANRQKNMRDVFSYVDQFANRNDTGPVVFTTLHGVYQTFTNPQTP